MTPSTDSDVNKILSSAVLPGLSLPLERVAKLEASGDSVIVRLGFPAGFAEDAYRDHLAAELQTAG